MSERLPRPILRSAFRAQLRLELLREAPSALVPALRQRVAWWRPLAAAAAVVAVACAVVLAADTAAAQSLPGEPPFAIKRTAEEVRVFAAINRAARVQAIGEQTDGRLAELRRATAQQRPAVVTEASRRLADTIERLAVEVVNARADLAKVRIPEHEVAIRKAERLAEQHVFAIEALLPTAPATARTSLQRAIDQARKIAPVKR